MKRLAREFYCDTFRIEYESECIKHDSEIFNYAGDQKGFII